MTAVNTWTGTIVRVSVRTVLAITPAVSVNRTIGLWSAVSEGIVQLPMGRDRSGMPALIPVRLLFDSCPVTCTRLREGSPACEQENCHS